MVVFLFVCRYLVDCLWLKLWKKYVGFDTNWEQYGALYVGNQSYNPPGPIDNSNLLLKGKALRPINCFATVYVLCKVLREFKVLYSVIGLKKSL